MELCLHSDEWMSLLFREENFYPLRSTEKINKTRASESWQVKRFCNLVAFFVSPAGRHPQGRECGVQNQQWLDAAIQIQSSQGLHSQKVSLFLIHVPPVVVVRCFQNKFLQWWIPCPTHQWGNYCPLRSTEKKGWFLFSYKKNIGQLTAFLQSVPTNSAD